MDKTTPEKPSKNKLSLDSLKHKRSLESTGNQVEMLKTELRNYSRDLATVSLALVKESEARRSTNEKLEDTLSRIKTKTREDIQTLNKFHQKSLNEQSERLGEEINEVRDALSKISETQKTLEHRFKWLQDVNSDVREDSRKNHRLASQLRSTTWQMLLAVLLLVSILSGVVGWFLHQQFMN